MLSWPPLNPFYPNWANPPIHWQFHIILDIEYFIMSENSPWVCFKKIARLSWTLLDIYRIILNYVLTPWTKLPFHHLSNILDFPPHFFLLGKWVVSNSKGKNMSCQTVTIPSHHPRNFLHSIRTFIYHTAQLYTILKSVFSDGTQINYEIFFYTLPLYNNKVFF